MGAGAVGGLRRADQRPVRRGRPGLPLPLHGPEQWKSRPDRRGARHRAAPRRPLGGRGGGVLPPADRLDRRPALRPRRTVRMGPAGRRPPGALLRTRHGRRCGGRVRHGPGRGTGRPVSAAVLAGAAHRGPGGQADLAQRRTPAPLRARPGADRSGGADRAGACRDPVLGWPAAQPAGAGGRCRRARARTAGPGAARRRRRGVPGHPARPRPLGRPPGPHRRRTGRRRLDRARAGRAGPGRAPAGPVRRSPAGLGPLLHRRPHRPHRARPARRGSGAPLCRALALPALRAAADPDPLRAALGALFAAAVTHGTDYPGLFAEARRCFPDLRADASPQA